MSGGSLCDYDHYRLHDWSETIGEEVARHGKNADGERSFTPYTEATLHMFRVTQDMCALTELLLQRVDYLMSSDDCEDDFHRRINEELRNTTLETTEGYDILETLYRAKPSKKKPIKK